MIENEFKILINQDFYKQLKKEMDRHPSFQKSNFVQINYYYDTKELILDKNNITLRIRQVEDALKLQIKRKQCIAGFICTSQEKESEINQIPSTILLSELPFDFHVSKEQSASILGSLVTDRTCFVDKSSSLVIMIDKNYYWGKLDFELEIEFSDSQKENAETLFHKLVPANTFAQAKGKRSRFLRAMV